MGFKQKLKNYPEFYQAILSVLNAVNYFDTRFHKKFPTYKATPYWRKRIDLVKQSADNERLGHVADAGKVFKDHQLMHNGLKITLGSYYDYGNTVLLQENKGVHEPQEEWVFEKVLELMPAGATMMELGSYWAFYSMWFASRIRGAQCFMIEPDPHKMNFGKLNFKLNGLTGTFVRGFIDGHTDRSSNIPTLHVDGLMERYQIKFLNLLHSDIQGYELKMLKGAQKSLKEGQIGFVFISTHSDELHTQCIDELKSYGYKILCDANLQETYSVDGLIVAKHPSMPGPDEFTISKNQLLVNR